MIGQSIAHYRILEKLGAGGMGVVYRAEDTKLGRNVALKVLPDAFAHDADRMARFEREAHLLASLNHPNIAAIYGLEESDGVRAIAMELVEGPSLADSLRGGPFPLQEALSIVKQVAEALEAAHEKGVIHRDLKPANVKVTSDGKVKVLDFGLAKALVESSGAADPSASPTISEIVSKTGVILGTAAYMSPEQARGKPLDKRTDIWSFGCLLFELLTGNIAFRGETVSDTIAQILGREPDWPTLPAHTPPAVRRLLTRCLQKDRQRRLRDIADARLELDEILAAPASGTLESAPGAMVAPLAWWKNSTLWLSVLICAVVVGLGVWTLKPSAPATHGPVLRFAITLPPTEQLRELDFPSVALDPTGTHLAFVASRGGTSQLFLRRMDSLQDEPVAGTERALSPFFSPDGQWVGFFASGKLMKVSIGGGAPLILCDAPIGFGAVWGSDDNITFAPTGSSGLLQVSTTGGASREVTKLDTKKGEFSHRWPDLLPDGKTLLFTAGAGGSWDEAQIVAQSLNSGEPHVLIAGGTYPRYIPTGHIVYVRSGSLMAVPFDAARLKVTGPPTVVLPKIWESIDGAAQLSVSPLGYLVFVPGGPPGGERSLLWVDRNGVAEPLAAPARAYSDPRLSSDGRRLAVTVTDKSDNVWIYDITTNALTQLTFEGNNSMPVWTPDGARLTFSASREGALNLFRKQADGGGTNERLTTSEHPQAAHAWSPDGRELVYVEYSPATGRDIWVLSLSDLKSQPILQSAANESGPALSHDGHWLAYVSDESGRNEVYIRPFPSAPGSSVKWQVSVDGGTEPLWRRDAGEIFFRSGNKMMAAKIRTSPAFKSSAPQLLFEGDFDKGTASRPAYDVSADGRRFLMTKASNKGAAPAGFEIVLEWFDVLKRQVAK
jgi:eukaryotic-like serine/threonine-protein kinase